MNRSEKYQNQVKAKEMFSDLGYQEVVIQNKQGHYVNFYYKNIHDTGIVFETEQKVVTLKGMNHLSMAKLEAINKRIEELEW